jgi:SAM-dependent methyltransferase
MNNCPVCNSTDLKALATGHSFCRACGIAFLEKSDALAPAPEAESLASVYLESKLSLFRKGLSTIKNLLSGTLKDKRLLDIGCGFGYFLKMAVEQGCEVEGIEISKKAVEHGRNVLGLKVYDKPLRELSLPDGHYDAATLWVVLDLLPDPLAELKEIRRTLKRNGIIFLRLNNLNFHYPAVRLGNTGLFRRLKLRPGILHRWGINSRALRFLLERSGFVDIKIRNCMPTNSDPYGTGGVIGPASVQLLKRLVFIFSEIIAFATFGKLLCSSALTATARKPQ